MDATSPLPFCRPADLADWLETHGSDARELWVRIYKAGSGVPSVSWNDCVVEAIRFGWIDGQKRSLDPESFLQRLTPRKPRSNWSARNRDHADRLLAEGRMSPAGLAHVEAAKADGRWDNAYAGSAGMTFPPDFLQALATVPAAEAFFGTLDRRHLYTIYYRLHTAKRAETRGRRMAQILLRLERGETFG